MHSRGSVKEEETLYKAENDIAVSSIKRFHVMVSLASKDLKLTQPTDSRTILTKRFMATNKVKES